ncbi:hypothetical protein SAMN06265371_10931 [Lutibacter agarilyticus]|uniref:Uncharacterized protein n=1 Tax=Lutibacter agarilyticus TaxID=1109740 RepID=A0A238YFG0_9FLAO|nr:hypothetical protein [Lutibacter agarilyticus]SNR69877.1 hypothetical protein SAMN06265371_10931 [Lutibacter agarilyticus]
MKSKILKDWQNREKSIEELHNDSIVWISEINFIRDEIRFLEHLLKDNYIDCLSAGLYKKIETLVNQMSFERVAGKTLEIVIKEQEAVLSNLIKTNSVLSNKNYLDNHRKLEFEMDSFAAKYKRIKKEIFEIIENVMKQKEQKKLLS